MLRREVLLMLNRESIQSILRDQLPHANQDLLCRLSEEVEKEMETHGKIVIRNIVSHNLVKTRRVAFTIDIKA
jgi:hypothetical protein